MIKEINFQNYFIYFIIIIIFSLVAGPAIPDITISMLSIFAILVILIKKKFDTYIKILLIVFGISLFTTLFSSYNPESFVKFLLDIRYFLFAYSIILFFKTDHFKYLIYSILFLVIFIELDLFYQFFFDTDIFGFEANMQANKQRLNGPFGDRYVPGSFLTKFSLPVIGYFAYKGKNNIDIIKLLFLILITFLAILITGERMALIFYVFGIILLFLFLKKIKFLILTFLIFSIIFVISILSIPQLKFKYEEFVNSLGISTTSLSKNENFFDSGHGLHYQTAYYIFLEHPFTGSGFKSFRHECKKDIYISKILQKKVGVLRILIIFILSQYQKLV